jgi:hypothetical protein
VNVSQYRELQYRLCSSDSRANSFDESRFSFVCVYIYRVLLAGPKRMGKLHTSQRVAVAGRL